MVFFLIGLYSLWHTCTTFPPKKGEKNYRMWADAQRDGRPAEYSCHPLQNFRNYIPCSMPQNLADARWLSAVQ